MEPRPKAKQRLQRALELELEQQVQLLQRLLERFRQQHPSTKHMLVQLRRQLRRHSSSIRLQQQERHSSLVLECCSSLVLVLRSRLELELRSSSVLQPFRSKLVLEGSTCSFSCGLLLPMRRMR
ncbi:hypothetical protein [Rosistilla oblonga]|uniref:hypothetical protein n=1 Tax=Rosistilla oblonga TaxID=2527990 RepID=UPI003A983CD5